MYICTGNVQWSKHFCILLMKHGYTTRWHYDHHDYNDHKLMQMTMTTVWLKAVWSRPFDDGLVLAQYRQNESQHMAKPSLMAARVGWIEALVQISPFPKKLFGEDTFPMRYALASLGRSLIIAKFSEEVAIYHLRHEHPKKLIFGGSKLRSYFFHL